MSGGLSGGLQFGSCEDGCDEGAPKGCEPGDEPSEAAPGGGEDGVGAFEKASSHGMLGLGVADDRFDRRASAEFTFDGLGDAASVARDMDLNRISGGALWPR